MGSARLRRLGAMVATGMLSTSIVSAQPTLPENPEPETNASAPSSTNGASTEAEHITGIPHDVIFSFGHDVELKAGDSAEAVVVIYGDAKVRGKVRDSAVVVWGNLDIDSEARNAVVVMGNMNAGPQTRIHDDAVTVAGKQLAAPGAKLGRNPTEIDFPDWLKGWVGHCVLLARPLAPQVGFVWIIALLFFVVYALLAVLLPKPVQACVNELTTRPATTCLIGVLSLILLPLVFFILVATGLGLLVVPFLVAAIFLAGLLGRVALLEWLGFKLVGQLGSNLTVKPLLALLIGALIIALLYMVPVLGLFTFIIISVWGLGAAMLAAFGGLRRELPDKPASPPPGSPATVNYPATEPLAAPAGGTGPTTASGFATAPMTAPPPVLPEVLSYPRAGFWERMGAGFLDMILVGFAMGFAHLYGPLKFLVPVAYFAGLWTWRGTTIGGIVLGLKVVRLDGQAVTFPVALVRSLAAGLSFIVLFLGFLWITWDPDKQGWHDKVAGTVVLKLPRGTPLVCL